VSSRAKSTCIRCWPNTLPLVLTRVAGLSLIEVTITGVIKSRPLNHKFRNATYPSGNIPFYLYGTPDETNIDYMLVQSPNIRLSADNVSLRLDQDIWSAQLNKGLVVKGIAYLELAMQPFPKTDMVPAQQSLF